MKYFEPNTNDNSTDDLQLTEEATNEIVDSIETLLYCANYLVKKLKYIKKKNVNIYNNDTLIKALKRFTNDKDVMYLAGSIEGSKIAPLSKQEIENRKFLNTIVDRMKKEKIQLY